MSQQQQSFWSILAGYIYSVSWSISFYGQLYSNYRLKSVQGFSLNYFIMNISGYMLYTIYMNIGYFTHIKGAGTVTLSDLIFVYHTMLMMILYTIQCIIYPKGKNKISFRILVITIIVWLIVMLQVLLGGILKVIQSSQYWNPVSVLGYAKLTLVLFKCFPQIYWNYKRKSTQGWSIFTVMVDLIGGVFSFISAGLSRYNGLNLSKILLGAFSIILDLIFAFQHFCMYGENDQRKKQYQKLQRISMKYLPTNSNSNSNSQVL